MFVSVLVSLITDMTYTQINVTYITPRFKSAYSSLSVVYRIHEAGFRFSIENCGPLSHNVWYIYNPCIILNAEGPIHCVSWVLTST